MQHFFTLALGMLLTGSLSAQSLCQNFDDCGSLTNYQREHTFNLFGNGQSGCLSNWEVTSGTPSVYGNFVPAYSGTDYALFGIHNNTTVEGAALKFDFIAGKSYNVTMALYNYNGSAQNIDFYLLDAPINYTYNYSVGASAIPAVPSGALLADSLRQFTSQQWQVVNFTVSNLTQNYSRLWIRQSGANNYLFLDSLCINEIVETNSYCQNFDDCGNLTNYEREHTFNLFGNGQSGCLADWEVTSGTPSVYGSFAPAFSGTDYALFGIHNSSTVEGAALRYNFERGKTYTVSVALYSYNGSAQNIGFYLLDAPINYTYNYGVGASAIPAVPATALLADSLLQFNSQQWRVVTFTVTNLNQGYNRLWIRQYGANNYLFIDSLCITEQTPSSLLDNPTSILYSLYPNPAGSELNVSVPNDGPFELMIYDMQGKLLLQQENARNLYIGHLSPGNYLAGICQKGATYFKRWVKQ